MKAVVLQERFDMPNLTYEELLHQWEPLKQVKGVETVEVLDPARFPEQSQEELIADAEIALGLWITDHFFNPSFFDRHPNLRYAAASSHGYGYIDKELVRSHGLTVTNTVYGDVTISQYAMALLMEVCNHVGRHSDYVKREFLQDTSAQRRFDRMFSPIIELHGKTMGVVGIGSIGYQTARMAAGFGMKVIADDPIHYTGEKYDFIEQVSFEELLERSDVISLHCPYTKKNENMINASAIQKMKDGVILINTARGGLVDEDALYEALMRRKIYAAGLDVLKEEPPEKRIPLMDCPYCTITGHIAWMTREAQLRLVDMQIENLKNYLDGHPTSVIS